MGLVRYRRRRQLMPWTSPLTPPAPCSWSRTDPSWDKQAALGAGCQGSVGWIFDPQDVRFLDLNLISSSPLLAIIQAPVARCLAATETSELGKLGCTGSPAICWLFSPWATELWHSKTPATSPQGPERRELHQFSIQHLAPVPLPLLQASRRLVNLLVWELFLLASAGG